MSATSTQAFTRLSAQRLGKTVLITNCMDWNAEQVVDAYLPF
jgi:hypothetical protein